jgi:hypothetical protein
VNPADGLYVSLSVTLAVPTDVPPEQSVGADACGPNTVNVTVPLGEAPPDRTPETDEASIFVPAVPLEGAPADNDGDAAPTIVSAIPPPHVETAALLFESPP